MALLPKSNNYNIKTTGTLPNKTYRLKGNKIAGFIDGKESIKQAIFLMLNTERYKHLIFSWDYGHELNKLIGKDKEFVKIELPRLIKECLTQDDRISNVENFIFTDTEEDGLHAKFKAVTTEGIIESEVTI